MATVNTNFASLSAIETAGTELGASMSLQGTLKWTQAAYDNGTNYEIYSYTATTSSHVAGYFFNGDYLSVQGSNLLSYPYTITSAAYSFASYGMNVSLFGSIYVPNAYSDPTGYLTKAVVTYGGSTVTLIGSVNVSNPAASTISSIKFQYGSSALSIAGNFTGSVWIGSDGTYHASSSGTVTSATLTSGSYSFSVTGMSASLESLLAIESATDFLSVALKDNDNINGTTTSDYLAGYAGNDTLYGAAAADTLVGGAGADTFIYALSGNGVDRITDFGRDDTIRVLGTIGTSGAQVGDGSTVSGFGTQVSSSAGFTTLSIDTNNAAGAEIQIQLDGTFTASQFRFNAGAGGSTLITLSEATGRVANDFGGDGKSDILWRNPDGINVVWNSGDINAGQVLGWVDSSWKVAGTGDFGGDGKADVLWRNGGGVNVVWNGGDINAAQALGWVDASWKVVSIADFGGDGKADILWRNAGGINVLWHGGDINAGQVLGWVDDSWKVESTADFGGDGKADILWRNAGGVNVLWQNGDINAAQVLGWVDTSWKVANTGDFGGDGKADILWRNDGGVNVVWNGSDINAAQVLGWVDSSWQVQLVGTSLQPDGSYWV